MDIKDVSAEISRSAYKERSEPTRRGSASAKASKSVDERDFFENSGRLGKVRSLIDRLVQEPDTSTSAVKRAKELLANGQLDNHEAAAKAADGLLAEGGGLLG